MHHGLPGHGWTVRKIACLCERLFQSMPSRSTQYGYLQQQRLSWKKCQKVLKRTNPEKRAHYMQMFEVLFTQVCREEVRLLYLDEAHLHRDLEMDGGRSDAAPLPCNRRPTPCCLPSLHQSH